MASRREARSPVVPARGWLAATSVLSIGLGFAAIVALVGGSDEPGPWLLAGAAIGACTTILVVRSRLELEPEPRDFAREDVVLDLTRALGSAVDAAAVRRLVLDAVTDVVGDELRYTAWVAINARGVMYPLEMVGPTGRLDRANLGIEGALQGLAPVGAPRRTVDSAGHPTIVVGVPCRTGEPAAVAVVTFGPADVELDETLAVLGSQAALALDALAQAEALHEKRSEARFQQLVRHSSDAVIIAGRDGRIRYQSPSVVRVLGYLTVDLDGTSFDRLVHPDDVEHVSGFMDQLVHGAPESVRTLDVQLIRADESVIHAEVVGSNLLETPDVRGVVLTIRDVSGRRALEDQLRHQAFHDALTGLSNRALFIDRVEHALARIRRSDVPTPAVAFIDLDDFKLVNDSLGHGAGDELLCVVADRLRTCLRSGDTPARLGGDEFAVLLEDAPDMASVLEVGERILDALHEPVMIDGRSVYARASVGIATRRHANMTPDELLRNADLAMYAAKANGKGCIEMFEPSMHLKAVDRLSIRGELERSVDRGEISVVYQPIVQLGSRKLVGFEALARWRHPERGAISPVEFIPIAEDTGIIVPLGKHVLNQACGQLATWQAAYPQERWRMSVNLSTRQVLHPKLLETVEEALTGSGLDPSTLMLELTESVLLTDSEQVLRRLHRLKDLGVQIAIDDFGTGYSSLSYLQRVPFDVLKIDRAFIAALRQDRPSATLVRTILDLGRTLGRSAIAEGVEEQIELDGLLELGCELGQGNLFGMPAESAAIDEMLAERAAATASA